MRTSQREGCNAGLAILMISRKRLRTLLRSTAPPMRRDVMKPILVSAVGESLSTLNTMNLP